MAVGIPVDKSFKFIPAPTPYLRIDSYKKVKFDHINIPYVQISPVVVAEHQSLV